MNDTVHTKTYLAIITATSLLASLYTNGDRFRQYNTNECWVMKF